MNDRSLASLVLIGGGLALMWWYRQLLPKWAPAPTGLDPETHVPRGGGMGDKKAYDYPATPKATTPKEGGKLQEYFNWPRKAMEEAARKAPRPGWPSGARPGVFSGRTPGINPAGDSSAPFDAGAALAALGDLWT